MAKIQYSILQFWIEGVSYFFTSIIQCGCLRGCVCVCVHGCALSWTNWHNVAFHFQSARFFMSENKWVFLRSGLHAAPFSGCACSEPLSLPNNFYDIRSLALANQIWKQWNVIAIPYERHLFPSPRYTLTHSLTSTSYIASIQNVSKIWESKWNKTSRSLPTKRI